MSFRFKPFVVLVIAILAIVCERGDAAERQVLVADRLTNSVYRYDSDGTFLNKVLTDTVNLNQPTGIALSSDRTKLYVSSFQNSRVVRYDYNYAMGSATNPSVFATQSLATPNSLLFSEDGNTLYVSNLGGTGVARFLLNGASAGAPIMGVVGDPIPGVPGMGDIFQFSGLTFAPTGELLVGGFQNFPGGNKGAVAKSNAGVTSLSNYIGTSESLNGTSGVLVHDGDVYVTSMFASNIQRFDFATGAADESFTISGLAFPQQLVAAPDGNGFLAGILGLSDGTGNISHYAFDGTFLGAFANHGGGGFTEATAFTVISPIFPGDFNDDGMVDGGDLSVWKNKFGKTGGAPYLLGDGDGDGDTDGRDFLVWQRQYGKTLADAISSVTVVPEPCGLWIMLAVVSVGVRIRA